jgi:hypothetical protein
VVCVSTDSRLKTNWHFLVDMLCAALVCQVYRVQNKVSSAARIAAYRTRSHLLAARIAGQGRGPNAACLRWQKHLQEPLVSFNVRLHVANVLVVNTQQKMVHKKQTTRGHYLVLVSFYLKRL